MRIHVCTTSKCWPRRLPKQVPVRQDRCGTRGTPLRLSLRQDPGVAPREGGGRAGVSWLGALLVCRREPWLGCGWVVAGMCQAGG